MFKEKTVAIGFNSLVQIFGLSIYLFIKRRKAVVHMGVYYESNIISNYLLKKGILLLKDSTIETEPGLAYKIDLLALQLGRQYYDKYIKNYSFIKVWNKLYSTKKVDGFLKRMIVEHICEVLMALYYLEPTLKYGNILLPHSSLDTFVIEAFKNETKAQFTITRINLNYLRIFSPLYFTLIVIIKLFNSRLGWRDKKEAKYLCEAASGLSRKLLRDDYFVDGVNIKKGDVLFYRLLPGDLRKKAFVEIKEAGYRTADINDMVLNLKNNIFDTVKHTFLYPLALLFLVIFGRVSFISDYIITFYLNIYPFYLLLTNYKVQCHLSSNDHGEIAETIIMNNYGCKNILYHWSDLTVGKFVGQSYLSHNILFCWGPIHYEYQKDNFLFDEIREVGCYLLAEYYSNIPNKKIGVRKSILLCDNSFNQYIHFTETFYIQYLEVILKMLEYFPEIDFLFKPKNDFKLVPGLFTNKNLKSHCEDLINKMSTFNNFFIYDHTVEIETLFPNVDLVINMGFNSPATIALLAGKEAIYYDRTENKQHPFSKYDNLLVYRDDESILCAIKDILDKKLSVHTKEIDRLLKKYDPFQDEKALERFTSALREQVY